jgi:translation elongation factor EF-Tu-like GTPase
VATGKIEQGVITVGQQVEILGLGDVLESVGADATPPKHSGQRES